MSNALARLIERFGAEAALPDVLMDLAACERFTDLPASAK
jgi:hypothetical protein